MFSAFYTATVKQGHGVLEDPCEGLTDHSEVPFETEPPSSLNFNGDQTESMDGDLAMQAKGMYETTLSFLEPWPCHSVWLILLSHVMNTSVHSIKFFLLYFCSQMNSRRSLTEPTAF